MAMPPGGLHPPEESGDLLEIADSRVATHIVLLLDVLKLRGVDVHPSQYLQERRRDGSPTCSHLCMVWPGGTLEDGTRDKALQVGVQPGDQGFLNHPKQQWRALEKVSIWVSELPPTRKDTWNEKKKSTKAKKKKKKNRKLDI